MYKLHFNVLSLFTILALSVGCHNNPKPVDNLRLMTYNIRWDNPNDGQNQWDKRKKFLSNQIRFYNPPVFGIQEGLLSQVEYLDNKLNEYKYIGVGRDDGKTKGEFCAVFYNFKELNLLDENTFWLSETPEKISKGWDAALERICTWAKFEFNFSSQQFYVFNTHFDHVGELARKKSAELILTKIQEINSDALPVFLIGDFNLEPYEQAIAAIQKQLKDSKESAKVSFGQEATFNGFNFHEIAKYRLDYIFYKGVNVSVLKHAVLSDSWNCQYPSDHFPVFAVFEF